MRVLASQISLHFVSEKNQRNVGWEGCAPSKKGAEKGNQQWNFILPRSTRFHERSYLQPKLAQGIDVPGSFLDLIKLTLPLKHLCYIFKNETYTIEIKVSKIKFLCEKICLYWKSLQINWWLQMFIKHLWDVITTLWAKNRSDEWPLHL